jgi:hypothetical protein
MKKKVIRLTESDLARIVRRVLMENENDPFTELTTCIMSITPPAGVCAELKKEIETALAKYSPPNPPPKTDDIMGLLMNTGWKGGQCGFSGGGEMMAALMACATKYSQPK